MKPVLSRKFRRCSLKTTSSRLQIWRSGDLWFCRDELGLHFEIAEQKTTLWLSLHRRKGINRLPLRIEPSEYQPVHILIDGVRIPFASDMRIYLYRLAPYIGKTLYLQVEYED